MSKLVIDTIDGRHIEVPALPSETALDALGKLSTIVQQLRGTTASFDENGEEGDDTAHDRMSLADELRHINDLRADGSISEQEFAERKAKLFATRKRP